MSEVLIRAYSSFLVFNHLKSPPHTPPLHQPYTGQVIENMAYCLDFTHDPVTWYKIKYTGEQVAQWDFQNKGRCIVLKVPMCIIYSPVYIILYHVTGSRKGPIGIFF